MFHFPSATLYFSQITVAACQFAIDDMLFDGVAFMICFRASPLAII